MLHTEQHIKTYFNEYFILTSSVNIITVFIQGWLSWWKKHPKTLPGMPHNAETTSHFGANGQFSDTITRYWSMNKML